jgi:hypothetical protein
MKFAELEKLIDPERAYKDREQLLHAKLSNETNDLKKQISELERTKGSIRQLSMQQLILQHNFSIAIEDRRQLQFIGVMLRSGYIDENYDNYISIFYDDEITKNDREFLLNIRSGQHTSFDFKLQRFEELIKKIKPHEFDLSLVFNYSLVHHLIAHKSSKQKYLNQIMSRLSDQSEESIRFIDGFLGVGRSIAVFIKMLANRWPGIWQYLMTQSNYDDKKVEHYFKLITTHAEVADIVKISEHSDLVTYIEDHPTFLNLGVSSAKSKELIEKLGIEFTNVDLSNAPAELIDFVYEGDYYAINLTMIEALMKIKGVFVKKDFNTANYSSFNRQDEVLSNMIKYIDNNLSFYLEAVWFRLEGPKNEDQIYFSYLLNGDGVSMDQKRKLIQESSSKIEDITDIDDIEVQQLALNESKVQATWFNLLSYYKGNEQAFDQHIIGFINTSENAKELSNINVELEKTDDGIALEEKFSDELILCEDIENSIYEAILKRIGKTYNDGLSFENISGDKVEMLLSAGKLNVTPENYKLLREHHPDLHITLAERDPEEIVMNLRNYPLDEDDIESVMQSERFTIQQKSTVLHLLDDNAIMANSQILKSIATILTEGDDLVVAKTVLLTLLLGELSFKSKLALIIKKLDEFSSRDFYNIMSEWPEPFNKIKPNGKQTVLPETDENWRFSKLIEMKSWVSKVKKDKKGIRIYNRRN